MRKIFGCVFLVLSVLAWVAIAALPFLSLSAGEAAGITAGLLIAGEVLFFVGVALLGKEVWGKIKASFWKSSS